MATPMQPQPYSDIENITDKEDDVKVCDICGDTGLEDSLAICSRCLDGAEHIYCMETMLEVLPNGDWLCELCKFNEYENQKVHKFEAVTKAQEQSYLNEDARLGSSTIYSKSPPKNDGSVIKEEMVDSRTLQIPVIPFMRDGENVDLKAFTYEKASKRSPFVAETLVPRVVSLLFPEGSSTNPDSATITPSNPEQASGSWSMFKGQKAQNSSGPQLKPISFKNTNTKPKVKQLLGAIPLAKNATGKFPSKNTREGALTCGMAKSTKFKTDKGVFNDFELVNEKQTVKLTQINNSSVERNIELGVTERESSFGDRGLIDGDYLGMPDTGSQRSSHPRTESSHQGDLSKIAAFSSTSKKPISGGSRIIQCLKCNETGHPTNLCSYDKHFVSAIKLSFDQMPWENADRSNKGKAARDTIMPKQEALKFTNTTNQSKEPFIPRFCHSGEVINKELPSHCSRRTYSEEGKFNATSSFVFDDSVHPHVANQTEVHQEAGSGRLNSSGNISKEFNMKHSLQILPILDSCLSNTLRTSVIPKLEFFWQGGFEVLRAGRLHECCDGLQAHFSSYASSKALEAAKNFPPYKVQLEEVSCISSWPPHFHGNAKEHSIALFFFAKDIESYRSNYCKLLEKMLKFDLALKGYLGGFELLIFPSNKLSENSQRWNRLLFLWGTFKGGGSSNLEVQSSGKQNICKSTMDVILPTSLPEVSKYQEKNTS